MLLSVCLSKLASPRDAGGVREAPGTGAVRCGRQRTARVPRAAAGKASMIGIARWEGIPANGDAIPRMAFCFLMFFDNEVRFPPCFAWDPQATSRFFHSWDGKAIRGVHAALYSPCSWLESPRWKDTGKPAGRGRMREAPGTGAVRCGRQRTARVRAAAGISVHDRHCPLGRDPREWRCHREWLSVS